MLRLFYGFDDSNSKWKKLIGERKTKQNQKKKESNASSPPPSAPSVAAAAVLIRRSPLRFAATAPSTGTRNNATDFLASRKEKPSENENFKKIQQQQPWLTRWISIPTTWRPNWLRWRPGIPATLHLPSTSVTCAATMPTFSSKLDPIYSSCTSSHAAAFPPPPMNELVQTRACVSHSNPAKKQTGELHSFVHTPGNVRRQ